MIGFERKVMFSEILIFTIKIYSIFHCIIYDRKFILTKGSLCT